MDTELLDKSIDARIAPVLINAAVLLHNNPDRSVFFSHFLAETATGISPFALDEDGRSAFSSSEMPDRRADAIEVLTTTVITITHGVANLLPDCARPAEPVFIPGLSTREMEEVALQESRRLYATVVEYSLGDKLLRQRLAQTSFEQLYTLYRAFRAFHLGDLGRAGALFALLSPTAALRKWRHSLAKRAMEGL